MDAKVHLKIIFIFNSEFFREFSHPKSVNYLLNWKSDSRIILVMFFTYLRINYTRLIPDEYTRAKTNIGVLAVIEANKLPTTIIFPILFSAGYGIFFAEEAPNTPIKVNSGQREEKSTI